MTSGVGDNGGLIQRWNYKKILFKNFCLLIPYYTSHSEMNGGRKSSRLEGRGTSTLCRYRVLIWDRLLSGSVRGTGADLECIFLTFSKGQIET